MKQKEIESESEFARKQLMFLLKLPMTLLKVLAKKSKPSELTRPFSDIGRFIVAPRATFALIMVNVAVFILEVFYFAEEQLIKYIFQPGQLLQFKIIPMIASWFLHVSLAHLLANMLILFIFGRVVEKHFGAKKMVWIYFGSAVISSAFAAFFGQGGVGASGAIAGVIAVAILYRPFYLTYLVFGIPMPIIVIGWLSIIADITGILVPKNDNIGHFAHLGGYLAISLLVFLFDKEERKKLKRGMLINIAFVIAAAGLSLILR